MPIISDHSSVYWSVLLWRCLRLLPLLLWIRAISFLQLVNIFTNFLSVNQMGIPVKCPWSPYFPIDDPLIDAHTRSCSCSFAFACTNIQLSTSLCNTDSIVLKVLIYNSVTDFMAGGVYVISCTTRKITDNRWCTAWLWDLFPCAVLCWSSS